tara:strand:- start:313 stop:690 length:378 start_codon:yes stop_codon:yes gene_type:complete
MFSDLSSFHKIVLTVATFILIVSLIALGIFFSKALFEDSFPPVVSDCPDYWDVERNDDDNPTCVNNLDINRGIGTSDCNNKDVAFFDINGANTNQIICTKKKWAQNCKIAWDGITNNNVKCSTIN